MYNITLNDIPKLNGTIRIFNNKTEIDSFNGANDGDMLIDKTLKLAYLKLGTEKVLINEDVFTKTEITNLLNGKQNSLSATQLANINKDVYSKTEINNLLSPITAENSTQNAKISALEARANFNDYEVNVPKGGDSLTEINKVATAPKLGDIAHVSINVATGTNPDKWELHEWTYKDDPSTPAVDLKWIPLTDLTGSNVDLTGYVRETTYTTDMNSLTTNLMNAKGKIANVETAVNGKQENLHLSELAGTTPNTFRIFNNNETAVENDNDLANKKYVDDTTNALNSSLAGLYEPIGQHQALATLITTISNGLTLTNFPNLTQLRLDTIKTFVSTLTTKEEVFEAFNTAMLENMKYIYASTRLAEKASEHSTLAEAKQLVLNKLVPTYFTNISQTRLDELKAFVATQTQKELINQIVEETAKENYENYILNVTNLKTFVKGKFTLANFPNLTQKRLDDLKTFIDTLTNHDYIVGILNDTIMENLNSTPTFKVLNALGINTEQQLTTLFTKLKNLP